MGRRIHVVGRIIAPPPGAIVAPDWAASMTLGVWYAVAGDTPDLGLPATPAGTRMHPDADPRYVPEWNPAYPGVPPYYAGGFTNQLKAWNSAVFTPTVGDSGSLLFHGGGHGGYYGSDVSRFDIATRQWSTFSPPSIVGVEGSFAFGTVCPEGVYDDGHPAPIHTYNYMEYDASTDCLVILKSCTAINVVGTGDVQRAHILHLPTKTWSRSTLGPEGTSGARYSGYATYDKVREKIIVNSPATNDFWLFDSSVEADGYRGSYGATYAPPDGWAGTDGALACDHAQNRLVLQDFRTAKVIRHKPLDNLAAQWTTTTITTQSGAFLARQSPWQWSDVLGGIVYQPLGPSDDAGSRLPDVYLIRSTNGWQTCDFIPLMTSDNGKNFAYSATPGAYQKFRLVEYPDGTVLWLGLMVSEMPVVAMRLN